MPDDKVPLANPKIVLREEFDSWAVLFDPETGDAYGLDPIGVFYWKRLDGERTRRELLEELKKECEDVPAEAPEHLDAFLDSLVERGYASFEVADE